MQETTEQHDYYLTPTTTHEEEIHLALTSLFGPDYSDDLVSLNLGHHWVVYLNQLSVIWSFGHLLDFSPVGEYHEANYTYNVERLAWVSQMLGELRKYNRGKLFGAQCDGPWCESFDPLEPNSAWRSMMDTLSIAPRCIKDLFADPNTQVVVLTDGPSDSFVNNPIDAVLVCQRQATNQYRLFYRNLVSGSNYLTGSGLGPTCLKLGALFYHITTRLVGQFDEEEGVPELQLLMSPHMQLCLTRFFAEHRLNLVSAALQPILQADCLNSELAILRPMTGLLNSELAS